MASLSIGLAGTCAELREMVAETSGSLSVRVFFGKGLVFEISGH